MSEQETEFDDTSYELSGDELRSTVALDDQQRFKYFVEKVVEADQVWTLGAGEELIVLAGEDDTPFVVAFPHPDFAQEWIEGTDIEEVELIALSAADWASEILPGLQQEGIRVNVFPTSEYEGLEIDAQELAGQIKGS